MDKKSLSKLCLDLIEIDQDKPEAGNEIAIALTALSTKVDSYAHVDKFAESQNLPDWAVETVVERVPNKTKIKEAIKSGEKVDGAELIENDYVVIK